MQWKVSNEGIQNIVSGPTQITAGGGIRERQAPYWSTPLSTCRQNLFGSDTAGDRYVVDVEFTTYYMCIGLHLVWSESEKDSHGVVCLTPPHKSTNLDRFLAEHWTRRSSCTHERSASLNNGCNAPNRQRMVNAIGTRRRKKPRRPHTDRQTDRRI